MNRVVSPDRKPVAAHVSTLGLLAGLILLPTIVGCPGTLSGEFVTPGGSGGSVMPGGTGGTTVPGSGGMTGGGTGGAVMPGTGGSGPPCDAPNMVFKTTCDGAACHSVGSPFGVFATDTPETGLVGKNALLSTGPCNGRPLIDSANPENSVVLTRVKGMTCGEVMPAKSIDPMAVPLTQAQIDCLTSWVASKR